MESNRIPNQATGKYRHKAKTLTGIPSLNTWCKITALLSTLCIGLFASNAAYSQLQCESGLADATCSLTLIPGVTLKASVEAITETNSNEYQINGDVQVVTGDLPIPLNSASLTVKLGDKPELYGKTDVPLDELPVLENAVFHTIPRAVIGFVNGASLPELVGESLPLNDGYSEGGTLRDTDKPYFLFQLDAGLTFSLDFGEQLHPLEEVKFSVPGTLKVTAILDLFDPYFYLSYSQEGGIDLNDLKKKNQSDADGELQVYEIRDENDEHVVMAFTLDPETGVLLEQNFLNDTQVYYERNADGDYVQQNVPDNPAILQGSQFDDPNRQKDKDQDKGKDKANNPIDAIGFSANGWIPFEARTVGVMPFDVAEFSGQFYIRGAIPLANFITLNGDVVTYIGEYGIAQGGNGDVELGIPGLPDYIDFNISLGEATAAYQLTEAEQKTYVSGKLKPDTEFLQDYLPIMPSAGASVVGYVGNDLQNTMLTIEGEMSLGAQTLGDWVGLDLNDLAMISTTLSIHAQGVELNGVSRMQISPDIKVDSEISVYAAISWNNPEDVIVRLTGNMNLFGVALENVSLEISSQGLAVNGAFVTPVTQIAMAGSITSAGPQLSGTGSISLDMGSITGSMQSAYNDLEAAQNEVQRLQSLIDASKTIVQAERDEDQKALSDAQSKVDAAKQSINSLNSSIASHHRSISSRRAQIASWNRWYKNAKWHQKPGRLARYTAEKSWRNADIARHYASIGTLTVSLEVAKTALSAANLAVDAIKAGLNLTPIELDPRVASLISAKEIANLALEVAKQPFKNVPFIDGDLSGEITLALGINGLSGNVSANISGFSLLEGSVRSIPRLQACIAVPTFGEACTSL
ncbi:MAG: hypothetical protein AB8B79_05500 [Granulosicoccus sp.]